MRATRNTGDAKHGRRGRRVCNAGDRDDARTRATCAYERSNMGEGGTHTTWATQRGDASETAKPNRRSSVRDVQNYGNRDGRQGAATQNMRARSSDVHNCGIWEDREDATTKQHAEKDGRRGTTTVQPTDGKTKITGREPQQSRWRRKKLQFIIICEHGNFPSSS